MSHDKSDSDLMCNQPCLLLIPIRTINKKGRLGCPYIIDKMYRVFSRQESDKLPTYVFSKIFTGQAAR